MPLSLTGTLAPHVFPSWSILSCFFSDGIASHWSAMRWSPTCPLQNDFPPYPCVSFTFVPLPICGLLNPSLFFFLFVSRKLGVSVGSFLA